MNTDKQIEFTAARNPCKSCSPLGACMAFRGIKNSIPFIHGGQGCATYIRRYLISHFREPVDIASSNFGESTTIFGGTSNLIHGLENVIKQYSPDFIGISTSCLAETIGEDLNMILNEFRNKHMGENLPEIVYVSTPSYKGTHTNGFHRAVRSVIENMAVNGEKKKQVNIFPGFVSPADIRYIKNVCHDFELPAVIVPDYSDTLDAPIWAEYKKIPEGGTDICELRSTGLSVASIELGQAVSDAESASKYLEEKFGIERHSIPLPIGIRQTDRFFEIMSILSGKPVPEKYQKERGRLIDSYVDAHKYLFDKKAVIYGDEDLVAAMANFLLETGIVPILCASGGITGKMKDKIMSREYSERIDIRSDVDFETIHDAVKDKNPDIIIGSSKGYKLARKLGAPMVRVGFPIHDRIGAQRILHLGYEGTQNLFDRITNALLEYKQDVSEIGYSYI